MSTQIDLTIGGMTCASCADRVERKLNKLDGVVATVNYATEKAHVTYPDRSTATASSRRSRPRATRPRCPRPMPPSRQPTADPTRALRNRFLVVTRAGRAGGRAVDGPGAAVPRLAVGRARARRARRRLGRVAVAPRGLRPTCATARRRWTRSSRSAPSPRWAGRSCALSCAASRHDLTCDRRRRAIYLEARRRVVLLGRWLEARSKRRAGAALTALLDLGAKEASVLRDGGEVRVPAAELQVGDRFVVRPGETIATDGVVEDGSSARRRRDAHRRVGAGRGGAGRRGRRRVHSTSAAAWSCARPGSAPTPSSPGWPASSRTRRAARPRCSGSPTGCRACSCRS